MRLQNYPSVLRYSRSAATMFAAFAIAAFAFLFIVFAHPLVGSAQSEDGNAEPAKFEYEVLEKSPRYSRLIVDNELSEDFLDQIEVEIEADKNQLELGRVVYGDSNSRVITTCLVKTDPMKLFVDLDRNKKISANEQIISMEESKSGNPQWQTDLRAEFVKNSVISTAQTQSVRFEYKTKSNELSLKTIGVMQGQAKIGDKTILARYLDRNSNGKWFDKEDRFFLDVNEDGKLDGLTERFKCQTLCKFKDQQFAIAGDRRGKTLTLEEVTGNGTIAGKVDLDDDKAKVTSLKATLASETGIRIEIDQLDSAIKCPVGVYHVESVDLKLENESGLYSFSFFHLEKANTVEVKDESEEKIDLLGKLNFTNIRGAVYGDKNSTLTISPMLKTGSGLYLIGSKKGASDVAMLENRLEANSFASGESISVATSGFS